MYALALLMPAQIKNLLKLSVLEHFFQVDRAVLAVCMTCALLLHKNIVSHKLGCVGYNLHYTDQNFEVLLCNAPKGIIIGVSKR